MHWQKTVCYRPINLPIILQRVNKTFKPSQSHSVITPQPTAANTPRTPTDNRPSTSSVYWQTPTTLLSAHSPYPIVCKQRTSATPLYRRLLTWFVRRVFCRLWVFYLMSCCGEWVDGRIRLVEMLLVECCQIRDSPSWVWVVWSTEIVAIYAASFLSRLDELLRWCVSTLAWWTCMECWTTVQVRSSNKIDMDISKCLRCLRKNREKFQMHFIWNA